MKKRSFKNESGQASILIGIMMLTFLFFFAFAVNIGMLVSAKINLQNAADLAAYAGAATQARQLNNISYLNYEMRREYKKFLFRYYVLGNLAQDSFPRQGTNNTLPLWSPSVGTATSPTYSYGVPAVCMVFNATDNFCHIGDLPPISIPPPAFQDAINAALIAQLKALENIRTKNCEGIGLSNQLTLMLWLYNTDPDLTTFKSNLAAQVASANLPASTSNDLQHTMDIIEGLTYGLGLVPRELLLSFRVQTLASFVNEAPLTGVTVDQVAQLQADPEAPAKERPIQAFMSAYNTLGDHTFSNIQMDEIMPTSGTGANALKLNPISLPQFYSFSVDFHGPGSSSSATDSTTTKCTATLDPFTIAKGSLPIGFYKDPTVLTYYAVRVRATAGLMFSPFGDLQLTAYAAARPFGSRIGPAYASPGDIQNAFLRKGPPLKNRVPTLLLSDLNDVAVPNLPVLAGDGAGVGQGWDTPKVLNAFYQAFSGGVGGNGSGIPTNIDQSQLKAGYQVAMYPNPAEVGLYNVMNDQRITPASPDGFEVHFDTTGYSAIWAPLFRKAQSASAAQLINAQLEALFQSSTTGGATLPTAPIFASMTQGMITYVNTLQSTGSNSAQDVDTVREGFNVVRLRNPFEDPSPATIGKITPSIGNDLVMSDTDVKSSWNVDGNAYSASGRTGYSVKIVSFDSLTQTRAPASNAAGAATWNNTPPIPPEESGDILGGKLKH